jgi:Tfp pilus tip-associated adhesin PilY1
MLNRSTSSPDHSTHDRTISQRLMRAVMAASAALLVAVAPLTHASQLNFASTPLFLQNVVQPNILFLLDDSGSMDWGILPNNGASADSNFCEPNDDSTCRTIDLTPDNATERLELCVGYNVLAFNPNTTYTPWKGSDNAAVAYKDAWLYGGGTDASPNYAVRQNPYTSTSSTTDVSSTTSVSVAYWVWTDSDSDDEYDVGECGDTSANSGGVLFSSMTDTQKKNYANWYSYYRIREYVLKRAVSELVNSNNARLGLATIHNNNSVGTQIADMSSGTNKTTLLTAVSRINSIGGTPLRTALNNAGKYFEGISQTALFGAAPSHTGTVSALSPVLSAANGGSCQQNFTILMTDGYYNDTYSGTGNVDSDNDSPNAAGNTTWDGGAFADTWSNTLADIAMHYYERDLWSSLPNDVPVTAGVDDADHQHMVTFGAAFGLYGTMSADPSNNTDPVAWPDPSAIGSYTGTAQTGTTSTITLTSGASSTNNAYTGLVLTITGGTGSGQESRITAYDGSTKVATVSPDWTTAPDPTSTYEMSSQDQSRIDDLRHASFNGRGVFLSAQNPQTLQQSLTDAIAEIANRTGSAASVAVNSRSLNTETRLYQATFTSTEWSGDLRALSINSSTGAIGSEVWSARDRLQLQSWSTGREIITRFSKSALSTSCTADTSSTTEGGVAFSWASLSTAQQCMLNNDPATVALDNDSKGSSRLDYLRGDATNEGGDFRARTAKLGDIVNSSPIYVGAPPFLPDIESVTHSSFRTTYYNRQAMVYVGGNDGMLHGFNASTGDEEIAYIPSMLFPNLADLTNPNYTHRYFVDGSATSGDAFGSFTNVSGLCGSGCWRTVLLTGMGSGAKGVFALDVTDPAGASIGGLAFDESNASNIALWEFTDSTTPSDMGHVFGRPTIARVRTSANTTAWAAIFGNGYNSTNERAILYIVDIATGAIIRKIDLSNGATGTSNGLSTAAVVDTNGDYLIDYVYAGDLRGNMWKVDLTDNNTANWGSYYTKSGNPAPLFIATDSNNTVQPITVRPEVGEHPDGESGYMVYFGTGKYLEDGDKTAPTTFPPGNYNYFYGIWDPHSGASLGGSSTARVLKARLRSQTISAVTYSGVEYRTVTDNKLGVAGTEGDDQSWGDSGTACNNAGGKCMGWVDSVPGAGEMMVSNPILLGGSVPRIIFTTIVPESSACSYGGQSWLMELNPIHGGRFTSDIFGLTSTIGATNAATIVGRNPQIGIMPEPTILRDPSNSRDLKIVTGSSGAVTSITNASGKAKGGRQSWRQLK